MTLPQELIDIIISYAVNPKRRLHFELLWKRWTRTFPSNYIYFSQIYLI